MNLHQSMDTPSIKLESLTLKPHVIEEVLYFLFFLSASWDIFGKIVVAGYSFRFFYLLELILFLLLLCKELKSGFSLSLFVGHIYFFIWMFFIALWMPNTTVLVRNVGYFFWMCFSCLLLILLCSSLKTGDKALKYFKLYLISYFFMAIFGVCQFLVGLLGISLKTTQWWIYGVVPRVNGLCYEPSYFGTYLAGGAVLLYWLTFVKRKKLLKHQTVMVIFVIASTVLTSSRIAILTLFFTTLLHLLVELFYPLLVKGKIRLSGVKLLGVQVLFVILIILTLWFYFPSTKVFLSGTGLGGTSSHSVSQRLQEMRDTFLVFLKNPIIGVSLGGIPSHRASLYGKTITTQLEAKKFEGMNVFVEVLAASGIIGYIFFILFWFDLIYFHYKLSKKIKTYLENNKRKFSIFLELKSVSDSLGIMIVAEVFALTMNQNILRPYFWLSLAFYMTFLKTLKRELKNENCNRCEDD